MPGGGNDLLASFQFCLENHDHLAGIIQLEPLPPEAESMLPNLALAFGIGVATNLLRSEHEEHDVTSLSLQFRGSAHIGWERITTIFTTLTTIPFILEGKLTDVVPTAPAKGDVFLVSGGKDTLFALSEADKERSTYARPGIYLGVGSELNWLQELPMVHRLARHFHLNFHHIRMHQMYISSKIVLRFGNRASWRELVTLALARLYGDHIFTGINNDALARLEWHEPHFLDFLSQLVPTLEALQQILNGHIETVPGEFEVYRRVRNHPLFNLKGSCLRPDCQPNYLCSKCRGRALYEKILSGAPLDANDIRFIHSDLYLGDSVLLSAYPVQTEVPV